MDDSHSITPAPSAGDWRQLTRGYLAVDGGDCQAMALMILQRCTGAAEPARFAERTPAAPRHPAAR